MSLKGQESTSGLDSVPDIKINSCGIGLGSNPGQALAHGFLTPAVKKLVITYDYGTEAL